MFLLINFCTYQKLIVTAVKLTLSLVPFPFGCVHNRPRQPPNNTAHTYRLYRESETSTCITYYTEQRDRVNETAVCVSACKCVGPASLYWLSGLLHSVWKATHRHAHPKSQKHTHTKTCPHNTPHITVTSPVTGGYSHTHTHTHTHTHKCTKMDTADNTRYKKSKDYKMLKFVKFSSLLIQLGFGSHFTSYYYYKLYKLFTSSHFWGVIPLHRQKNIPSREPSLSRLHRPASLHYTALFPARFHYTASLTH